MQGNSFSRFISQIPPVTRNLIIINLVVWLVGTIFPRFGNFVVDTLGLHYTGASDFNPVQIITYLFVHAPNTPTHVLFNMFTLWMFGSTLEMIWGSRRYFVFYFICGIGAALVQEIVWAFTWLGEYCQAISHVNGLTAASVREIVNEAIANNDTQILAATEYFKNQLVTIGASGAVFGIIMGFAMVFPDRPLYLLFLPIPIKAKYMMIGYGVIEFFLGVAGRDMVAHFAHLGGMLFGLVLLLWWRKKGTLRGGYFY